MRGFIVRRFTLRSFTMWSFILRRASQLGDLH